MYDVIIVGAGVAGSYLASLLEGLNVLLIEKNKKPALRDSGVVSSSFFSFFPGELVHHEIREMDFVSPSGILVSLSSGEPFSYIIRRLSFSNYLLGQAAKGAAVVHETVLSVEDAGDFVRVRTDSGEYAARLVVGADGALSIVRRSLSSASPEVYTGIFEISSFSPFDRVTVFVNKYFSPDFFAWEIPQTCEHGTIALKHPDDCISFFKRRIGLPDGQSYSYSLPLGPVRSYGDRFILIGEAAGQTKPVTGGGIIFAARAAWHAKLAIEAAFRKGDFSASSLSEYDSAWRRDFGSEIRKQLLFRRLFRRLNNNDIEKIFRIAAPALARVDSFDYDMLSGLAKLFPRSSLARIALPKLLLPRFG